MMGSKLIDYQLWTKSSLQGTNSWPKLCNKWKFKRKRQRGKTLQKRLGLKWIYKTISWANLNQSEIVRLPAKEIPYWLKKVVFILYWSQYQRYLKIHKKISFQSYQMAHRLSFHSNFRRRKITGQDQTKNHRSGSSRPQEQSSDRKTLSPEEPILFNFCILYF